MKNEPKNLTRNRIKEFFCELFDSHEWIPGKSHWRNGREYIRYRCKKCGKEKEEPAPIIIATPFFVSRKPLVVRK